MVFTEEDTNGKIINLITYKKLLLLININELSIL